MKPGERHFTGDMQAIRQTAYVHQHHEQLRSNTELFWATIDEALVHPPLNRMLTGSVNTATYIKPLTGNYDSGYTFLNEKVNPILTVLEDTMVVSKPYDYFVEPESGTTFASFALAVRGAGLKSNNFKTVLVLGIPRNADHPHEAPITAAELQDAVPMAVVQEKASGMVTIYGVTYPPSAEGKNQNAELHLLNPVNTESFIQSEFPRIVTALAPES